MPCENIEHALLLLDQTCSMKCGRNILGCWNLLMEDCKRADGWVKSTDEGGCKMEKKKVKESHSE